MEVAARRGLDLPDETAGQNHFPGLDALTIGGQAVDQREDAGDRVVQHARAEAGFLDHAIARNDDADPAQVEGVDGVVRRAKHDPGVGALSATVSMMLRVWPVAGSARSIRVSWISRLAETSSVAATTSARVTCAPRKEAFMTKAISASTLGWMKRLGGTVGPLGKCISSSSTPESGVVMPSALCIARDVRPIFQPDTFRPAASFFATSAD